MTNLAGRPSSATRAERMRTVVDALTDVSLGEEAVAGLGEASLPSVEALRSAVSLVADIVFPGFFDKRHVEGEIRRCYIGKSVEQLASTLSVQVARALAFGPAGDGDAPGRAADIAVRFVERLPRVKELLYTDVDAMLHNDPAVTSSGEVIFCYPMVRAMLHHRVAHELLVLGVPVVPRIIAEMAHSQTGIDIHPGAQIGDHFCIDHGTGIVIGETCVIGSHVMLYQGVTLGAKSFSRGDDGMLVNEPRHPIIEDHVTIYSNSSVLGRITIGHHSVIGGNVWLTHGVPPHSVILQRKAVSSQFTDGAGI